MHGSQIMRLVEMKGRKRILYYKWLRVLFVIVFIAVNMVSRGLTCSCWRNRARLIRVLYILFLGQLVSFALALSSFFSSLIAKLGVNAPLTQSLLVYFALAVVYGSILLYRRQKLQVSWYWYFLLGFVDVQGNYLFNKAFQFSSLTSVTLLDCCIVGWAIMLTWMFIGTRYSLGQLFGALICVLGLGFVLCSDARVDSGGGSRPLLGDILVVIGTLFLSMSNVGEEFLVKKKDRVEAVTMMGVYGFLVSLCGMYPFLYRIICIRAKALEVSQVFHRNCNCLPNFTLQILALAGFVLSGILFYTIAPFVLKVIFFSFFLFFFNLFLVKLLSRKLSFNSEHIWILHIQQSGATVFTLSCLTSDMWAVVFRIFLYNQQVDWSYYIAFATILVGLIIYSTTGNDDSVPLPALEDGDTNTQYQLLNDENGGSTKESLIF
ncbi:hypothetical protein FEM48_Zijuj12G0059200 [Ziziphus jujuba var. spinosa]|uniref:Solute carrier family 35 member F1-like n=1 Tax=Ziziphus jujuba var. spinosa TaxID=714518 RepID=A0A978UBK0_ZIZJJ|nr:hypothetical protein FEM48_Zijuj12G0059200 [Ziziphus jujuba var. spinosa]